VRDGRGKELEHSWARQSKRRKRVQKPGSKPGGRDTSKGLTHRPELVPGPLGGDQGRKWEKKGGEHWGGIKVFKAGKRVRRKGQMRD